MSELRKLVEKYKEIKKRKCPECGYEGGLRIPQPHYAFCPNCEAWIYIEDWKATYRGFISEGTFERLKAKKGVSD